MYTDIVIPLVNQCWQVQYHNSNGIRIFTIVWHSREICLLWANFMTIKSCWITRQTLLIYWYTIYVYICYCDGNLISCNILQYQITAKWPIDNLKNSLPYLPSKCWAGIRLSHYNTPMCYMVVLLTIIACHISPLLWDHHRLAVPHFTCVIASWW